MFAGQHVDAEALEMQIVALCMLLVPSSVAQYVAVEAADRCPAA